MGAETGKQNIASIYRLTATQEGILFHAISEPGTGVYFQQFTCLLDGELDAGVFERAWNHVVARHDAVRALFTWERRDKPLQVIRRTVRVPFRTTDDAELVAGGERLESLLAADRREGFRLDEAPLMRVVLVRGAARRHRLVWSFHHIVLDGWSMRLFLREVLEVHADLLAGVKPKERQGRPFQDYVAWLGDRDQSAAEAYWKRQLDGFDAPTEIGGRGPGGRRQSHEFGEHARRISRATTALLRDSARAQRVTLNTLVRGAWALLLARYSGDTDVVFGATVSGRPPDLEGVESMVGMFINTVPVRAEVTGATLVGDWLRGLQDRQLEASEFDTTPLTLVQGLTDVPRGTPLFESIVVFENLPPEAGDSGGLRVSAPRHVERSNYPLALLVVPGDELELIVVHDLERYSRDFVDRLARHVERLVVALATNPELALSEIDLLDGEDREELERLGAGAAMPRVEARSVVEMFRSVAAERPQAAAVIADGRATAYAELDRRVRALASLLVHAGVGREACVGICVDRSPEALVAIFATLAAGGAYAPIDPEWPAERMAFVLADTAAELVITTREREGVLPAGGPRRILVDAPIEAADAGRDLLPDGEARAYVIYTSGSTGRPKGVEVTHANLAHSTVARFEVYAEPVGRYLLLSPLHFDSSVAGVFWTLCQGGTLVLPPPGLERDVRALADLIAREKVTHLLCLPQLYELLIDHAKEGELDSLRLAIVAGEACPVRVALRHAALVPSAALYNEYGPTEATVWATVHHVSDARSDPVVPIGRPIPGTRVFLLDAAGRPVPYGIPGELYVVGPAVARGYLGRSELSGERFVSLESPTGERVRAYRTGDRARFREDGSLEYLGRVDEQVKIRGQRIEPGEIEAAMQGHPGVKDAVVVVCKPLRADDLVRRLGALEADVAEQILREVESAVDTIGS